MPLLIWSCRDRCSVPRLNHKLFSLVCLNVFLLTNIHNKCYTNTFIGTFNVYGLLSGGTVFSFKTSSAFSTSETVKDRLKIYRLFFTFLLKLLLPVAILVKSLSFCYFSKSKKVYLSKRIIILLRQNNKYLTFLFQWVMDYRDPDLWLLSSATFTLLYIDLSSFTCRLSSTFDLELLTPWAHSMLTLICLRWMEVYLWLCNFQRRGAVDDIIKEWPLSI